MFPNGTNAKFKDLYFLLIQAGLFAEDGISRKTLMKTLDVSYRTLSTRLETIAANGLLVKLKKGKSYYYKLDLNALDDFSARGNN